MFNWLFGKNKQKEQHPIPSIQKVKSEHIHKSIEETKLETYLNKLVICASNEVENLTIGYGKEIVYITKAKIPMLVIYDIVNKKEITPFCKIFDYTEQKFNALNKLEPNERISILYDFGDSIVNKKPLEGENLYSHEVWAEKVQAAITEWKNSNQ